MDEGQLSDDPIEVERERREAEEHSIGPTNSALLVIGGSMLLYLKVRWDEDLERVRQMVEGGQEITHRSMWGVLKIPQPEEIIVTLTLEWPEANTEKILYMPLPKWSKELGFVSKNKDLTLVKSDAKGLAMLTGGIGMGLHPDTQILDAALEVERKIRGRA